MKPLVIYHDSCADGFGAAFAAWLKLGDEAEYEAHQYGADVSPDMMAEHVRDREVYILDFSFPKLVMEHIFKAAKRVVWLDHHASVFKDWDIPLDVVGDNEYFSIEDQPHWVELDNNKSGAMLAWEYFHPGTEVPMFIRHIDDYDRWQFKIEGTKAFNKALRSYAPWGFEQWDKWFCQSVSHGYSSLEKQHFFKQEGNAILRAHNQNVQSVVKGGARKCQVEIHREVFLNEDNNEELSVTTVEGLAANCPPHLQSDVGHELANQSGTYGLLWYINKDGQCKCSLRSNGDYDVSAIAKAFGGGGHRNAAGFTTDIQTLLGWLKATN